MISVCLPERLYANLSTEIPGRRHAKTLAVINTGHRSLNDPRRVTRQCLLMAEVYLTLRTSDPICFCPKRMTLTHPPTSLTDSSQGGDHMVVYTLTAL